MLPPVSIGDVILGKYRVRRVLGKGGMGVVVEAEHLHLADRVAIKFLLPGAARRPGVAERFQREARAARRITSEHVVRVDDFGELPDGAQFLVMEYLEGEDLSSACRRAGRLPIAEAVGHVVQACDALTEAHAKHVVHRDLKPANLFLARRPDGSPLVKVLDFGISKLREIDADHEGGAITGTLEVIGSPHYMAPEQMRAMRDVDGRADVWALGATLYELLAGARPFEGNTTAEICARVLSEAPRPLAEHRPEVPADLAAIVRWCLEKPLDRRLPSVAHLAVAIAPFGPPDARLLAQRIARLAGVPAVVAPPAGTPGDTDPVSMVDLAPRGAGSAALRRFLPAVAITGVAALALGVWLGARAGAARSDAPEHAGAPAVASTGTATGASSTNGSDVNMSLPPALAASASASAAASAAPSASASARPAQAPRRPAPARGPLAPVPGDR
jgi:hypothetical protein